MASAGHLRLLLIDEISLTVIFAFLQRFALILSEVGRGWVPQNSNQYPSMEEI